MPDLNPKRPTLVVCNILLSKDGHLLMGLRADTLQWECPGGKVDDETVVEAGQREMLEESGMTLIGTPQVLGCAEVQVHGRRWFLVFVRWSNWQGVPLRKEEEKCLQWRWYDIDDLPPLENCTEGTSAFLTNILPGLLDKEKFDEADS